MLIFRGKKKPSRHCDQQARATEAANYDKDVEVLWQPKSWADIETCVEWAEGCLTSFVALELKDEPYLLLCDNLNGQLADPFKAAMTKAGNSTLWFGPKGATHIWQPVDHHVGVRYKNMMSECYEEFLADREDHLPPPTAAERRVLLTQWAGKAYRALEKERDEKEATCKTLENPTAEQRSMFFKAFLRTGCLVDPAGKFDFEIHPHSSLPKGREFLDKQYRNDAPAAEDANSASAIYEESKEQEAGGTAVDSEDEDDEPNESGCDSSQDQEPIPDDMEIAFVQDEAAAIRQARAEIPPDDLSQLLDFNFAKRVATECSSAATDTYTTTTGRGGRKRKTRFDNLVGMQ